MADLKNFYQDAKKRMTSAIEHVKHEFTQIRTGRSSPALLDSVKVPYYGSTAPLKTMANITSQEARLLVVQPFDKNLVLDIEKAIQAADLGLNPANDGNVIRVPIPALTEERRNEMVKLVHTLAEEGRIAVRNVRKDINNHLRELERSNEISENEGRYAHDEVQKITDDFIEQLNKLQNSKEKEIKET